MIIRFLVDLDDGQTHIVPVSCQRSWTVLRSIIALRQRINLPKDAHVSIRFDDGSPVNSDRVLASFVVGSGAGGRRDTLLNSVDSGVTFHAIVDMPMHLLPTLTLPRSSSSPEERSSPNRNATPPPRTASVGAERRHPNGSTMATTTAVGRGMDNSDDDDEVHTHFSAQQVRSSVTRLGPQTAKLPLQTLPVEDEDEDDGNSSISVDSDISEETERLVQGIGIHTIKVNQHYRKSYATRVSRLGDTVVQEHPIVSVAYPQQLVEVVRHHDKLASLTYDRSLRAVSTIVGLDDDDFAKYLSISMIYGLAVRTGGRFDSQIAFFADIMACRHSCYPNTVFQRNTEKAPFEGMLRCATRSGIEAGDEVTYLYPHVDKREYVVLPRDRRERLLRRYKYLKEGEFCSCSRCWKADRDENEVSITGAFFDESIPSNERDATAAAMRNSFQSLHIVDEAQQGIPIPFSDVIKVLSQSSLVLGDSKPIPSTAAEQLVARFHAVSGYVYSLLQFISVYSKRGTPSDGGRRRLELHLFHWRISLVRLRILEAMAWLIDHRVDAKRAAAVHQQQSPPKQDDSEPSPATQQQQHQSSLVSSSSGLTSKEIAIPFSKLVFDVALDQMEAEAVFLPVGHPLALITWRIWKRMLAQITPKLAAGVQQRARSNLWCPHVDWSVLDQLDQLYRGKFLSA